MSKPRTIELTDKRYKAWMLIGGAVAFLGGSLFFYQHSVERPPLEGVIVTGMGIAIWAGGRCAAWWNHG